MGRFGRSTYLLFDTSTGTTTVRELSGRPSRVIVSRETQTRLRLNNGMNLIDKSGRPFSDG
jgi:hypothetical protein